MINWVLQRGVITLLLALAGIAFSVWGAWLFTIVTFQVFFTPVEIPTTTGAVYGTFFGIVTIVVIGSLAGAKKFWQWRVDKHDSKPES